MIETCWFVFKWGLLAALVAGAGLGFFFYSRVNDEIRLKVQALWQEHYPDLVVTVRSAQLVDGEGIEIRGLSLLDPNAPGPRAELAYIDEIVLKCQTSLPELLQGPPKITRALIRRPTIHATRRPDGTWSAGRLLPIPKFTKQPHEVVIEGGSIEFFDPLKNPPSTLTLRDVNLQLKPMPSQEPSDRWATDVRGYLGGDHFQRIELSGRLEPDLHGWDVSGVLTGLDISPELRDTLPADIGERLSSLDPLRGQARIGFHLRDNPAAGLSDPAGRFQFQLAGQLAGGRFDDPRLPYPLTDLKIDFRADNRGLVIDELKTRAGQATLRLAGRMEGFQPGAPLSLEARAEHLLLGRQWEPILPEGLLTEWRRFEPAGEVNLNLKLDFDGHQWRPRLTLECVDGSFSYFKFPYRMDRVTGTLALADNRLTAELTAFAASRPLTIRGEFENPGPRFTGGVQAWGELPFDENLFAAMQPKARESVRALNPTGTFGFYLHVTRVDPNQPASLYLSVRPNQISVRYDKFPYPIHNVRGSVVMTDGHWTFRDMEGTNGQGRIRAEGFLNPNLNPVQGGSELNLHFAGENIPLQDEIRDALHAQVQRLWNQLKPQGTVNLTADLKHFFAADPAAASKPEIHVRVEPLGDSMSIEPACFPYRLEKVHGTFVYADGHIDLQNVRAVHSRTPLETNGFCDFDSHGNWRLRFDRLAVDHLRADRDLLAALSGRLKKVAGQMNPEAAVNLAGSLEFSGAAAPDQPVRAGWDLSLDVQQGTLDGCTRLENITGGVRLSGAYDGRQIQCRGRLNIDSLTMKDLQFMYVRGPFYFDDKQLVFGAAADNPPTGQPPQSITAQLYGGVIEANAAVLMGDQPRYAFSAILSGGDLKRFAQETVPGKQHLDGRVWARIDLPDPNTHAQTLALGVHSLTGRGQVRLTQAEIYQLPFMIKLLKLLSVKTPDATAFTTCQIDYHVEGDHVYFDKISFNGDAVSLDGSGEMDFDTNIKLTFHSRLGRTDLGTDLGVPLLSKLAGAASRQLMQIHVTGTLAAPKMTQEYLPAVTQPLQQAQAEIQSRDRAAALP